MAWEFFETKSMIKVQSFISAFTIELNEGFSFHGESHEFWEILYVLDGSVCVSADDRVYNLEKNEIIFHKPMELHKFHIENGKYAKIFVMSFSLSGELITSFENLSIALSKRQKAFLSDIIDLLEENRTENKDPYKAYMDAFNSVSFFSQQLACMTELFLLSVIQNTPSLIKASNSLDAVIFKKAVFIMDKYIYDWIAVDTIASQCNVSVSYLKKIFTKHAGLGVHKYFLKLKIIHACALLKENKSVTAVSQELNFSSQNYFSMVFKRETGISPLTYKNSLLF